MSLLEEFQPSGGDPNLLVPAPAWRLGLQPSLLLHQLHVPAERGLLDTQNPADRRWPDLTSVSDHHQDIRLAHPQPMRPQHLVVQGRDHSVNQAHADRDAFVHDAVETFGSCELVSHALGCTCNRNPRQ